MVVACPRNKPEVSQERLWADISPELTHFFADLCIEHLFKFFLLIVFHVVWANISSDTTSFISLLNVTKNVPLTKR